MMLRTPAVLLASALALAGTLIVCQRGTASPPPSTSATPTAAHSPETGRSAPGLPLLVKAAPAKSGTSPEVFTGSRDEVKAFIGYYHSIRLTPEQERIKVEALTAMPAPCCSKYSLATCCCPCNMAKAAWGLAARLITEKGADAEQIRLAEASWLKKVNPKGFSGDSCFTGGCARPMRENGCGGMKEEAISF